LTLLAVSIPVAWAGSGGLDYPSSENLKQGRILFVAACGGCHTLAAAGTTGRKGPNLAEEPSGYQDLVEQIMTGGEGMPGFSGHLLASQVRNIAAFVVTSTPSPGANGD
jgi:mono/diheme cytochrome c family protein